MIQHESCENEKKPRRGRRVTKIIVHVVQNANRVKIAPCGRGDLITEGKPDSVVVEIRSWCRHEPVRRRHKSLRVECESFNLRAKKKRKKFLTLLIALR